MGRLDSWSARTLQDFSGAPGDWPVCFRGAATVGRSRLLGGQPADKPAESRIYLPQARWPTPTLRRCSWPAMTGCS